MIRDYSCSLCSTRYDHIPPDGCFCSDSAITIFHDGKESQERRAEEERKENQRIQSERQRAAAQQVKPKASPQPSGSSSSSSTGVVLGVLAFLITGYFLKFQFELEWIAVGIIAVIAGVLIRYTYKLIIFLIVLLIGYYIYDQFLK